MGLQNGGRYAMHGCRWEICSNFTVTTFVRRQKRGEERRARERREGGMTLHSWIADR